MRPDDVTLRPSDAGQGVIIDRTFQRAFYLNRVAMPSGSVVHSLEPHTEEHDVGTRVDVGLVGRHTPICFVEGRALPDGVYAEGQSTRGRIFPLEVPWLLE